MAASSVVDMAERINGYIMEDPTFRDKSILEVVEAMQISSFGLATMHGIPPSEVLGVAFRVARVAKKVADRRAGAK